MSTLEYTYQEASHDDLLKVIRWAQNRFCLQAWDVTLDTGPKIPRELMPGKDADYEALTKIEMVRLRALVWVPIGRFEPENCNPIEACLHEMVHILHTSCVIEDEELLTRLTSPLFYQLYCYENELEIPPLKQE